MPGSVPSTAAASHALEKVFDNTILSRHALHPLADTWVAWLSILTKEFGAAWADLKPPGPRPIPDHFETSLLTDSAPDSTPRTDASLVQLRPLTIAIRPKTKVEIYDDQNRD